MSMASKHDHPSGYVLMRKDTSEKYSDTVYRTMAGAQRSSGWKNGWVDILSVHSYEEQHGQFL